MALEPDIQDYLNGINRNGTVRYSDLDISELRRLRTATASQYGKGPEMAKVENIFVRGREHQIPTRIYYPEISASRSGILVFFHGGGWVTGGLEERDTACRMLARAAGIVVASVNYRLAPEHLFPAALIDAYDSVSWLSENATEIGVDPNKLAVGGDSAGANLATVSTILARDQGGPKIAFQLLLYPAIDASKTYPSEKENAIGYSLSTENMEWYWSTYLGDDQKRFDPRVSPILCDDLGKLPPAHIVTAGYDPLRDEGESFANALIEAGNRVTLTRYENAIHGFFCTGEMFGITNIAIAEASNHLKNYLS